ncbi:MAG: L-seryl-tRNA(Sec) selenium transferase [Thermoleophilaceae bacterium]
MSEGEGDSPLRSLPSVERLAQTLEGVPAAVAVVAAREAVRRRRAAISGSTGVSDQVGLQTEAQRVADGLMTPSPRRVINATGVVVHTNLGRAPLSEAALAAIAEVGRGYCDLEHDLDLGRRGSRQDHVAELLCRLTGAEAGLVVNNGAAAALLACAALGGGGEIVVSRGQLVEIGGSFRVPEIVAQSGARLVEVGTTNRTRLADYEQALGPDSAAILRVHQSNFRTVGFTEQVEIEPLGELAERTDVPLIDDVGSGALAQAMPELADEPPVRRSVAAGAALTCFSGDKLLGGPQAGILVGSSEAIERCRRHPLARAVRIDKLSLAALGATLRLYQDPESARRHVPVLRMLTVGWEELAVRAEAMARAVRAKGGRAEVIGATGRVGGGALPLLELPGPVCALDPAPRPAADLATSLRRGMPPVIARVRDGRVLLDPRTMSDAEAGQAGAAAALTAAR